jgi:hypothetical protein
MPAYVPLACACLVSHPPASHLPSIFCTMYSWSMSLSPGKSGWPSLSSPMMHLNTARSMSAQSGSTQLLADQVADLQQAVQHPRTFLAWMQPVCIQVLPKSWEPHHAVTAYARHCLHVTSHTSIFATRVAVTALTQWPRCPPPCRNGSCQAAALARGTSVC